MFIRSHLYTALALSFNYPTPALIRKEPDNYLLRTFEVASQHLPNLAVSNEIVPLRGFLSTLSENSEAESLRMLEVEYNRLFVGMGAPLVYPYESLYVAPRGSVVGETVQNLLQLYAQEGLTLSPDFRDLPDHLTVELEFMACLCLREEALQAREDPGRRAACRDKERDFLVRHLLPWVPTFCKEILSVTTLPFYQIMARLTRDFLYWEQGHLKEPLPGGGAALP